MHCSYRTISSGVTAVALTETFLGVLPGWGGTYLLPHLIGPANALKVIIENPLSQNRMLTGSQAHAIGIADAMFEPGRLPGRIAPLGGPGADGRGRPFPGPRRTRTGTRR